MFVRLCSCVCTVHIYRTPTLCTRAIVYRDDDDMCTPFLRRPGRRGDLGVHLLFISYLGSPHFSPQTSPLPGRAHSPPGPRSSRSASRCISAALSDLCCQLTSVCLSLLHSHDSRARHVSTARTSARRVGARALYRSSSRRPIQYSRTRVYLYERLWPRTRRLGSYERCVYTLIHVTTT